MICEHTRTLYFIKMKNSSALCDQLSGFKWNSFAFRIVWAALLRILNIPNAFAAATVCPMNYMWDLLKSTQCFLDIATHMSDLQSNMNGNTRKFLHYHLYLGWDSAFFSFANTWMLREVLIGMHQFWRIFFFCYFPLKSKSISFEFRMKNLSSAKLCYCKRINKK